MVSSSAVQSSFLAVLVGCCLYFQQFVCVSASLDIAGTPLRSRSCVKKIAEAANEVGDGCVTPVCGPLNTTGNPFQEHLTPSCRAVFDKYVAKESLSWADSLGTQQQGCKSFPRSQHPTNPVVIQNQITNSFGFCSVPKAGCSQLRSLLFVMTRFPDPVNWCASAS